MSLREDVSAMIIALLMLEDDIKEGLKSGEVPLSTLSAVLDIIDSFKVIFDIDNNQ